MSLESIKNLNKEDILRILTRAKEIKSNNIRNTSLQNKILGMLFFEPSTRTCLSFETAIYRLGGKILKYNSNYSSEKKFSNT